MFGVSELDDEDIISQSILFFLAGFHTTSTLLCFVCHQLATHPDVQIRLQQEIDKTLEENGGKFTYEAVHSMKYLDMVVSGENGHCSYAQGKNIVLYVYSRWIFPHILSVSQLLPFSCFFWHWVSVPSRYQKCALTVLVE
jgi:hypothetical protein